MNKKTELALRRITEEVAKICGMDKAMAKKPDKTQAENKKKAKEVLIKTRLPNDWTMEENITIAKQMQSIIDEPVRMVQDIDERRMAKYDQLLNARIKNAIKNGQLPDPKKDKDLIKTFQLFRKEQIS